MRNLLQHDRRIVGWLWLAQLISWGSIFYIFSLVMEPVERDLGLSRAQSSLAFSLALLVEGLLAYPVGRWIDRGHERAVKTGGSVLAGICLLLQGSVTGMVGFYAVWVDCDSLPDSARAGGLADHCERGRHRAVREPRSGHATWHAGPAAGAEVALNGP